MALRLINPSRKPLLHVPRPSSSFSSSSSNNNNPPFPPPPPPPSDDPAASARHQPPNHGEGPQKPAASSLFLDIRDRLKSSPASPPPRRIPANPLRPGAPPAAPTLGLDDIKRTLESYRAVSPRLSGPGVGGRGANPSFQDLLKSSGANQAGRPQGGAPNAGDGKPFSLSFANIRESIRKLDPQHDRQRQPPLRFLNNTPENIFGKELRQRAGKPHPGEAKDDEDDGVLLTNQYTPEDLGKMLRDLRPADAGKDGKEWFSLEELQGRIAKIVEQEKSNPDSRLGGTFGVVVQSLGTLDRDQKEHKKHVRSVQHWALFANIGGKPLPEYMLSNLPPQEELLERYFHPDHVSGEEKMKLELQKVRDEFKMSENDCGSARVQIAQLTLKIKHLSTVLHKKDKHSRKGLQDMVQRRKKYLKYLRRTDWDSYCLVLSKLGLRDTPEYKAPDYKKTQPSKAQSKKSKSKRKRKMKA
ncbi:hypothetical protein ZWY2020_023335 [Hordeum vulgare]|uniref:Small ribosomal subunit protein uS15c n=1 Tax=Hordeum vulgare subsp. vulgare TaxID=112509 RepID=F2ECK7_HORVV|nr:hypothetical protein ZWY2020_023335 [Hordeum vulgare]BAK05079.1 predicted protein [Hordeum vulgare subsp. vulgare]